MTTADETIKQAVKETIQILAAHFLRGESDSETTLNRIAEKLDNGKIREAVAASDSASEHARQAAVSQREDPEDYPKQNPEPKKRTPLYTSENGDTWWLCSRADGVAEVLHQPNPKSGGQPSRSTVADFLAEGRNGPEHEALRRVIAQSLKAV